MVNHHSNHPFHLVDFSPWPLTGAIRTFSLVSGLVIWFHHYNYYLLLIGFIITLLTIYQWWRDISREGTYQGLHTDKVLYGLKVGILLFIISEVFFFFSFF
jgi:cytochrome c oxidase subunit 3